MFLQIFFDESSHLNWSSTTLRNNGTRVLNGTCGAALFMFNRALTISIGTLHCVIRIPSGTLSRGAGRVKATENFGMSIYLCRIRNFAKFLNPFPNSIDFFAKFEYFAKCLGNSRIAWIFSKALRQFANGLYGLQGSYAW